MKVLSFVLASCLLSACTSGPVVHTDHDPAAVFSGYRTFAWKQQPQISNPLLKQRVVAAVEAELRAKGWSPAPEAEASVVLVGNVSARDEQSIDAFYTGQDWNGWEWRGGYDPYGGLRRIEVRSYKVGALVLDMFDARTKQAVWRGTAEGTVPSSDARREKDALAAVHSMFGGFPPSDSPGR